MAKDEELAKKYEQIDMQNTAIRERNQELDAELKKLRYQYDNLLAEHLKAVKALWGRTP